LTVVMIYNDPATTQHSTLSLHDALPILQNAKNVEQYQKLIDKGESASIRGFTLSPEDHLRQFVINQLICQFSLSFNDIQQYFSVAPKIHFQSELEELAPMIEDGLLLRSEEHTSELQSR